jgi:hypothetical protein
MPVGRQYRAVKPITQMVPMIADCAPAIDGSMMSGKFVQIRGSRRGHASTTT